MARPAPHLGRIAISLLIVGAVAGFGAEPLIFEDGFETGDTSMWGAPPPPPPPLPIARLNAATATIMEDGGEVTLLVELTGGGAGDVRVDWAAGGGTATAGADFSPASGTVTLNGAVSSAPITVTVIDDQTDEYD